MNQSNLTPWLVLVHAIGFGPAKFKALIEHYSDVETIAKASANELSSFGLSKNTITAIKHPDMNRIEADISWSVEKNHHILTFDDARYPPQLKNISDPPIVLYVRGDTDYLMQPQLAIVGSRTPTASGKKTAFEFARHLSDAGLTITSGLAQGIDGECHKGALKGLAGTIALVAHGLDIIYPAAHQQLAQAISESGAIVSEVPIGTAPLKGLFPSRNRIISGLSLGTLVVEAAIKSGTLITARLALEQGREVFAIPGSIHNPLARGCHLLIRQGAKLVETAQDIIEELSGPLSTIETDRKKVKIADEATDILDPDHQKLLKCLAYDPISVDELVNQSGFTAAEVASMLLIMELEGNVVCQGGLYTRISFEH